MYSTHRSLTPVHTILLRNDDLCSIGYLKATIAHIRVTLGRLMVTLGHLRLTIGYLEATIHRSSFLNKIVCTAVMLRCVEYIT